MVFQLALQLQMVFVRVVSCLHSFLQYTLDDLLYELSLANVGCFWRWMFAGVFCFADDIALLAPCASALRKMLSICSSYAASHGLIFNSEKTQLICFRKYAHEPLHPNILFNGISLQYSDKVLHLGHLLSFDLNDKDDIIRATKDVNRKADLYFSVLGSICNDLPFQNVLSIALWLYFMFSLLFISKMSASCDE